MILLIFQCQLNSQTLCPSRFACHRCLCALKSWWQTVLFSYAYWHPPVHVKLKRQTFELYGTFMRESKREFAVTTRKEISICLRYGTKRLERRRNVKADAEERRRRCAHLDMDSINSVCQRAPSAKTHSLVYFQNTQHLCTGWGGHLFWRFCNLFSKSSPCFLGQHGSCSIARRKRLLLLHPIPKITNRKDTKKNWN